MQIGINALRLQQTLSAGAVIAVVGAVVGIASPMNPAFAAWEPEHHTTQPHAAPAVHGPAKPTARKAKTAPTAPKATASPTPAPDAPVAAPETPQTGHASASEPAPDADAVLSTLTEGNARWTSGKTTNPHTDGAWRAEVAKSQHPFVTVLTCADSRLPVERIFDQGVGDVFVVRVAGNVAGASEIGTIEYGVGHLKTPVLVVMGHTKCGAVAAAAANADVHGKLAELVNRVKPGVERARKLNPGATEEDVLAAAIKENIWQTVFDVMKESAEIRGAVAQGRVRVVGAMCDITTGKVQWMGEHPWQSELLASLKAADGAQAAVSADE